MRSRLLNRLVAQTTALRLMLILSTLPAALLAVSLLISGNDPRDVGFSSFIVFVNAFSGAYIWSSISLSRSISEAIAVGYGLALLIPSALLFLEGFSLPSSMTWLFFPAVSLVWWLLARRGPRPSAVENNSPLTIVSALGAATAALALFRGQLFAYSTGDPLDTSRFHPDIIVLQAMVQANPEQGLGQIGVMSDWSSRYHWLSYAWAGSIENFAQSSVFFAQVQLLPVYSVIAIALLSSALAARISPVRWVPGLAALAVLIGRPIADSSGLIVNWDSPSQVASGVALLTGVLIALALAQQRFRLSNGLSLVPVAFLLTGMKASAGAILVGSLTFPALAFRYIRRQRRHTFLVAVASSALGAALFWLIYQSGQETGGLLVPRELDLHSVLTEPWILTDAFGLAAWRTASIVPACAGSIFLLTRRSQTARSVGLLSLGALTFGLLPIWLFEEGAPNSSWFLASAMTIVGAVSAAGAAKVIGWLSPGRRNVLVPLVALVTAASTLVSWSLLVQRPDSFWRAIGPLLVIPLWILFSFIAAWLFRSRQGIEYPPTRVFAAVLVISGVLIPIGVVANERVFGEALPRGDYVKNRQESNVPGVAPLAPLAESETEIASQLSDSLEPGSIVGFTDDRLFTPTLLARLQPFATAENWASLIGPTGTYAEFRDRRSALGSAIGSDDTLIRTYLCDQGVTALLSFTEGATEQLEIEFLSCSTPR